MGNNYAKHFLLDQKTAIDYAVDYLKFFESKDCLECQEIGDGNINYVFRVRDVNSGRSVIIKQADMFFRNSRKELDPQHNVAEAGILIHQGKLAPEYVPQVYDYNQNMYALSMEDIGAYRNTRKAMLAGEKFPTYSHDISEFMACTLIPTTDLCMNAQEKKRLVVKYMNPDLCEVTERLVLSDPFWSGNPANRVTEGNEEFFEKLFFSNSRLQLQVAKLRDRFMNNTQALIHGDLHSGSIFGNQQGLKVIDPEFACYGPIGYDVGNVIGNLFFQIAYWYCRQDGKDMVEWLEKTIEEVFDRFFIRAEEILKAQACHRFYKEQAFINDYLDSVKEDTMGYAGTEMARRTVGAYKVAELDSLPVGPQKLKVERILGLVAESFILNRDKIKCGKDIIDIFHKNA